MTYKFRIVHVLPDKTEVVVADLVDREHVTMIVDHKKYIGTWVSDQVKVLRKNQGELHIIAVDETPDVVGEQQVVEEIAATTAEHDIKSIETLTVEQVQELQPTIEIIDKEPQELPVPEPQEPIVVDLNNYRPTTQPDSLYIRRKEMVTIGEEPVYLLRIENCHRARWIQIRRDRFEGFINLSNPPLWVAKSLSALPMEVESKQLAYECGVLYDEYIGLTAQDGLL